MAVLRWALAALLVQAAIFSVSAQDAADTAVVTELELGEVTVTLKDAEGFTVSTLTGTYPKAVLSNPQVPQGGALDVSLTVKTKGGDAFKAQQVMVQLKSKSFGVSAYAVAKLKSGTYTATVGAAVVEKQIGKATGEYEVHVLVGDPTAPKALDYALGTAELLFSAASSAPEPAAALRTAHLQPRANTKPEIHHIFRLPEKRPPAGVSLFFTALALVPLAAVVLYVPAATGVNFKAWSVAPLAALLFHCGLAAVLLLYLVFFLQLNLAQTLPLAGLGGGFVAASGYWLLSSLSAQRLKKAD
ncbi:hypothetical protein HYH03_018911 [Edaphochlamys debaryana]|uniref:Ribophorin II n=1 Tax=Edaphochlamys debaryana TaxID=47281 RepID=A0A836BMN4_9CHLO|nr:hypothetical protein HYH03_018911 [Edaphochlamys debaryana]|eukprot:KAG2482125.1 hypothetical protein HYH03_018911 [Edaphochlamys debaryana]